MYNLPRPRQRRRAYTILLQTLRDMEDQHFECAFPYASHPAVGERTKDVIPIVTNTRIVALLLAGISQFRIVSD